MGTFSERNHDLFLETCRRVEFVKNYGTEKFGKEFYDVDEMSLAIVSIMRSSLPNDVFMSEIAQIFFRKNGDFVEKKKLSMTDLFMACHFFNKIDSSFRKDSLTISISEEFFYMKINSRTGDYYPEIFGKTERVRITPNGRTVLTLKGELLVWSIIKALGIRMKSVPDFEKIDSLFQKKTKKDTITILSAMREFVSRSSTPSAVNVVDIPVNALSRDGSIDYNENGYYSFSKEENALIFKFKTEVFVSLVFSEMTKANGFNVYPIISRISSIDGKESVSTTFISTLMLFCDSVSRYARIAEL